MSATYSAETNGTAVPSASWTTVLGFSSNIRTIRLAEWGISFDGTTSTDTPVTVQVVRTSTAGTGASVTPAKRLPFAGTANASLTGTFTVEPTFDVTLESHYVTPYGGLLIMQYPEGAEPYADPTIYPYLSLRVYAPSAPVNCSAWVAWDEL